MECIFWDVTDNHDHPTRVMSMVLAAIPRIGDKVWIANEGEFVVENVCWIIPAKNNIWDVAKISIHIKAVI